MRVGRDTFLQESGIDMSGVAGPGLHEEQGFSTLYVAKNSKCIGWIGLQDKTRPEARHAVDELLDLGVKRMTMLTGDRQEVANRVAAELYGPPTRSTVLRITSPLPRHSVPGTPPAASARGEITRGLPPPT